MNLPAISAVTLLVIGWAWASWQMGPALVPSPISVITHIATMISTVDLWRTIAITLARGLLGLVSGLGVAVILGLLAGRHRPVLRFCTPIVAALQTCPTIVWLTLLMVWAGTGGVIPVSVVFVSVLPPLFANTVQGCINIDPRLFDMAKIYRLSEWRIISKIVFPSTIPYVLAGLSYSASVCWKVTVMAEFLGADEGIGAKIFWAYRMLEMPTLFAWAILVTAIGIAIEIWGIAPMRLKAQTFSGRIRNSANA
jgi:ABC-type nitrate/sulfonate/bicarbonate transport system permease component